MLVCPCQSRYRNYRGTWLVAFLRPDFVSECEGFEWHGQNLLAVYLFLRPPNFPPGGIVRNADWKIHSFQPGTNLVNLYHERSFRYHQYYPGDVPDVINPRTGSYIPCKMMSLRFEMDDCMLIDTAGLVGPVFPGVCQYQHYWLWLSCQESCEGFFGQYFHMQKGWNVHRW